MKNFILALVIVVVVVFRSSKVSDWHVQSMLENWNKRNDNYWGISTVLNKESPEWHWIQQIHDNLESPIRFLLVNSNECNAECTYTSDHEPVVVIYTGVTNIASLEVMYAMLAHELGHVLNGDMEKDARYIYSHIKLSQKMEYEADMRAVDILQSKLNILRVEAARYMIELFEFWAKDKKQKAYYPPSFELYESNTHYCEARRIRDMRTLIGDF